jgi:NADPH-dependent 2,4-dienoyl-CoA reductase/sulfur reductase-like enzyme
MPDFRYVIAGGGMAAGYAAKEMAARGLQAGELAIVSLDDDPPYERPPLSKGFLAGTEKEDDLLINKSGFYDQHGITLCLRTFVERIDGRGKRLRLGRGAEIGFEKLLISTGSRVRTLDLPRAGLPGIFYLRSLGDAKLLRSAYHDARRAVVLGGGFIGMEVAAVLTSQGVNTTLVFPDQRIWQQFFTPEMSAFFQRYYEDRGVRFVAGAKLASIEGTDHVQSVVTTSGERLVADLVVVGIGVVPEVEQLKGSGVRVDDGVVVNEYLETSIPDIYAAGDVARYSDVIFERYRRVGHWDNAVEQGKHVAKAMLGERVPFKHVPYFFSDVFDLSYEFWGDNANADAVVYRGDVMHRSFSAWWLRRGTLVAAFIMNRPEEERALAPGWIADRRRCSADELRRAFVLVS